MHAQKEIESYKKSFMNVMLNPRELIKVKVMSNYYCVTDT